MSAEILVLIAAVVNYILGWIWYSAFGRSWMTEFNLSKEMINNKDPKPYLIAFITSLWSSYGVFLLIKYVDPKNIQEVLSLAIGAWLFLLVAFSAKHYAFRGNTLKGFIIDYGLNLLGIIVMCLIIW